VKIDDVVKVYPHGKPEERVDGRVVMISENQRAIAVALADPPPWWKPIDGLPLILEHGFTLLARRVELNGQPWGPWIEVFRQGHYEIEAG
jgi:hypothetical protein